MNYSLHVRWPHFSSDDPARPHEGVYLQDGKEEAGSSLEPGDLVLTYETKTAPNLHLVSRGQDTLHHNHQGGHHEGRQGIIGLMKVLSSITEVNVIEADENGEKWSWRWKAEAVTTDKNGFIPREVVVQILGYSRNYYFRGFGDLNSGLRRTDKEIYDTLYQEFKKRPKRVLPPLSARRQIF